MKFSRYVVLGLIVLCLFSCSDGLESGKGSLKVDVNRTVRTISPDSSNIRITRYSLVGSHVETGTPIDHSFMESSVVIPDMLVGEWTLRVAGYNAAGAEVATSDDKSVIVENSKVKAAHFVVSYDQSRNGTFSVYVDVPEIDTSVNGVKIELVGLGSSSSDTLLLTDIDASVADGRKAYSKSFSLVPGRWDVVFSVIDVDGQVIGKPYYESLHVYAGETSSISLPWSSGMFLKTQAPIFSLATDEVYVDGTELVMYSEPGAVIHYTFNGSNPLNGGPIYDSPHRLLSSQIIKAYALKDGLIRSEIVEGVFKVKPHAPTVDDMTEVHSAPFDVVLNSASRSVKILYTLDGSEPTLEAGTLYSQPIHIETPLTLKARAYKDGCEPSDLLSLSYRFDKQTGNFEIDGPVEYKMVITDASGHPLDTMQQRSVKVTLTPDVPTAVYEWFLDGVKVPGVSGNTVTIGDTVEDINVAGRNSAILTVKASWAGYSLTENIVLIYLGAR